MISKNALWPNDNCGYYFKYFIISLIGILYFFSTIKLTYLHKLHLLPIVRVSLTQKIKT